MDYKYANPQEGKVDYYEHIIWRAEMKPNMRIFVWNMNLIGIFEVMAIIFGFFIPDYITRNRIYLIAGIMGGVPFSMLLFGVLVLSTRVNEYIITNKKIVIYDPLRKARIFFLYEDFISAKAKQGLFSKGQVILNVFRTIHRPSDLMIINRYKGKFVINDVKNCEEIANLLNRIKDNVEHGRTSLHGIYNINQLADQLDLALLNCNEELFNESNSVLERKLFVDFPADAILVFKEGIVTELFLENKISQNIASNIVLAWKIYVDIYNKYYEAIGNNYRDSFIQIIRFNPEYTEFFKCINEIKTELKTFKKQNQ